MRLFAGIFSQNVSSIFLHSVDGTISCERGQARKVPTRSRLQLHVRS